MTNDRPILDDHALDVLFREARTFNAWQERDVSDALLQAVYELAKMGPTAANSQPMRVVFVKSPEAKEKLKAHLDAGNVDKTMSAPVTAIVAFDVEFYEKMPEVFPHAPTAINWFKGQDNTTHLQRNSSLEGAYLMLAARSLGLDCGPMSGFNNAGVDAEFFAGTNWKSNFIFNIGYGDKTKLFPRLPRLAFDDAAKIV
jgi:3-hydroxypropanoate dehydrogenase